MSPAHRLAWGDFAGRRCSSRRNRLEWLPVAFLIAAVPTGAVGARAETVRVASYAIAADAIAAPLDGRIGDAARGRRIVLDRENGNCLICHKVPVPTERFQGDLGPDLSGVGSRLTMGQLRLRVVDQRRLNPASVMPPYHRVEGTTRVGMRWRGVPVLDAQSIEDVVAWLATLKE